MSNQVPNDPRVEIDDTIKHRRTEDNLGVLWVWMGIFKERIKILEYKVERDNNTFYDMKCRMNSTDEKLEYRLSKIEKQLERSQRSFWAVVFGTLTTVTATVIVSMISRR